MSKKSERRKSKQKPAPRQTPAYFIAFAFLIAGGIGGAIFLNRTPASKPPAQSAESLIVTPSVPPPGSNVSNVSKASNAAATIVSLPDASLTRVPAGDWRAQVAALPKEKQAEAYSDKGDELFAAEKFDEAVEAYRLAIQEDASSEAVHYNLGIALARLGKREEAIAAYTEALKIAPDYAEAHNNLGNLRMQKKEFAEAIKHFTEATKINPEIANSHNNLGIALVNSGRPEEATAAFAKAVSLDPKYLQARFNLAQSYLARGETNAAVGELAKALEINPNFTPAQRVLDEISGAAPK